MNVIELDIVEAEVVDGTARAVGLAQPAGLDDCHGLSLPECATPRPPPSTSPRTAQATMRVTGRRGSSARRSAR